MRYHEILNEFLIRLDGVGPLHRNPLPPQILSMFQERHDRLRGVIVGGKIYVWDAWDAMHSEMLRKMVEGGIIEGRVIKSYLRTEIYPPSYTGFMLSKSRRGKIKYENLYDSGNMGSLKMTGTEQRRENRLILDKYIERWNS